MHARANSKGLLIGQLAAELQVKPDTIRFYEKSGLLKSPERTGAGYRLYDQAALKQLRFIKRAQALGFSLAEIKRILTLRNSGRQPCACVLSIAEATLAETERKLSELQTFHRSLKANVERWRRSKSSSTMAAEFCALIESP